MSDITAGIDLGTSNSKIGVFLKGKVQIVPNSIGDPSSPSIVAFLDDGQAIAEETIMSKADEKHTITEIKRLIGKNISDIKDFRDIHFDIVGNNNKLQIRINRKGKDEFYSPEQIMALIFEKLIKNASEFVGTPVTKAIISVPAYFDQNQKLAIRESAKMAKIEVMDIINDPIAAALAYGLGTKENLSESLAISITRADKIKIRKVLVFDLGGGTFDAAILTIEKTNFNVKSLSGDPHLGGIDFDNKLINFCLKDFCGKMQINQNDVVRDLNAMKRLKIQCEKGKKNLTYNDSTIITAYNFFNGKDLFVEIKRDRFDEECEDLYKKIEKILDQILKESKFSIEEIDDVILIGGSSKIPKIKEIIKKKFNFSKIRDNINQDDAVVIGATWKAHNLLKNRGDIKVLDISPSSYGVGTFSKIKEERDIGQVMSVLIKKNTSLPAESVKQAYKTFKDNQTFFKIKIYSGEDKYIKNNKLIGNIIINNLPPKPAGSVYLYIKFNLDTNGILSIDAEVQSIGKTIKKTYSIYNEDNQNKNPTTIIKLKENPKSKQELDKIKLLSKTINEKKAELKKKINDNDKFNILKEIIEPCSKILTIYEELRKGNDSESLYEKILEYTKLLITYYSEMIILDKEDKNSAEFLNKIKEQMPKFKNDNIENLIDTLDKLKNEKPKIYIEIVLYTVKILYEEGDKILNEMKPYAKYYSKKFYVKAENIKKYIDEDLKKKMDYKLEEKFKEIEKNYKSKNDINPYILMIKKQIEEKNTEYFPKKAGFTVIKKILKGDDYYTLVDLFQEIADSQKELNTEIKAYCYAHIIKFNFEIFQNYDFALYDNLNRKIDYILGELDIDKEEDEEDHFWIKSLNAINKEIKKKKVEIENKKKELEKKFNKCKDELREIFNNKINENKPKEFLEYITNKYPYTNFDLNKNEELMKKDFEFIFKDIFPKYHPDNYTGKDDFSVYEEIYKILVDMDIKYIKKQINDN